MPENKFNGTVDEILEDTRAQAEKTQVDDSTVDEILASLGIEGKAKAKKSEWDEVPTVELPVPASAEEPVKEPAAPAEKAEESKAEFGSVTGEIMLGFVNSGSEPKAEEKAAQPEAEAPKAEPAPEAEKKPAEQVNAAELRVRFDEAAEPTMGFTRTGLDQQFSDFFNTPAMSADGQNVSQPTAGLFDRFIKKGKPDASDIGDKTDILVPGVPVAVSKKKEADTGEVRLPIDVQDETGQIDAKLVSRLQTEEPTTEVQVAPKAGLFAAAFKEEPEEDVDFEGGEASEGECETLKDAPAVKEKLAKNVTRSLIAVAVSGAAALIALVLGVSASGVVAPIIDPNAQPQTYLIVQLILLAAAVGVNATHVLGGLKGVAGKASADTLPALAAAGSALQIVAALAMLKSYDPTHLTLFAPIACILLCADAVGYWVQDKTIQQNFDAITTGSEHSAAYRLQNVELTDLLAEGLEEEKPVLLISRPAGMIKGFIRKSAARPRSDKKMKKLAQLSVIVALLAAVIALVKERSLLGALTVLAGALCMMAPLSASLFTALCGRLQQSRAARVGAVVPGWGAVEELGKINTIVAEAKDVFPRGSVVLNGIKTFEKERIDLAILYAASVLIAGCDTLRDVFLSIIQNKTEMLYKVESLVNERGRGFTAWIDGSRVIVGNRNMMMAHSIEIPSLDYEKRYTKGVKQPVYLAVSGKLFGMFVVDYTADKQTAQVLRSLQESGISVLIKSDDFSINGALVERVFNLRSGSIKVLTEMEQDRLEENSGYLPESEGCMVHLGSFASYVGGMRSASHAADSQRSALLVLTAGIMMGAAVSVLLAISGGLVNLALPVVVLYQAAWCVSTLALPLTKKF